ncbi:MAG: tetratricopeptide repeat protein [Streptosporangiaceae bacterium]
MHRRLADQTRQAQTHCSFAMLATLQNRPRQAVRHAGQALRLFQATGHRPGQAVALNMMGWELLQLGDLEQARYFSEQALQVCTETGNLVCKAYRGDPLAAGRSPRAASAAGVFDREIRSTGTCTLM